MADKTLKVTINATDNASAVFAKVGNAAKTLGSAMEQSIKSSKGLGDFVRANESNINTLGKAMVGVGGVMSSAFVAPIAMGTKAAWAQVDAVQKATVALRAYEKDATKVDKVLSQLVAYARSDEGVLFQRQDLFAAAQGLKVAGAETQNLTRYVEVMARAVAVGMTNWGELTQVIQRVGSTGRLAGYDFDMLTKAGFQLDTSLRNQAISWEQLFSALDRGIPGMGDALNTIQGQTIRLMSGIRELGLAFLQVDRDTSQFIQGGLGDQLYRGLGTARDLALSLVPAAENLGRVAAIGAQGVGLLADAYLALPGPVQEVIGTLGGFAGVALAANGALLLMLPRIVSAVSAFKALRVVSAASSGLSLLLGALNPLTLGIGALVLAGGYLVKSWMDQRHAAQEYRMALSEVGDEIELLRRRGDEQLANSAEQLAGTLDAAKQIVAGFKSLPDDYFPELKPENFSSLEEYNNAYQAQLQRTNEIIESVKATGIDTTEALLKMREALNDPDVDAAAFISWAQSELDAAGDDAIKLAEAVNTIESRPLSDFAKSAKEAATEIEVAAASLSDFMAIFADFPAKLDDLRLDGKMGLASQFESMRDTSIAALTDVREHYRQLGMPQELWGRDGILPEDAFTLSEDQLNTFNAAFTRVMQGMSSDMLDNAAIVDAWNGIISAPISVEEKLTALTNLSTGLAKFIDSEKAMREGQLDFLGDGDRILDWWTQYQQRLRATQDAELALSANSPAAEASTVLAVLDQAGVRTKSAFDDAVQWAGAIGDAGAALDQALRTFKQIDDLGSRSSSAGSIAENLVGKPGEWAAIDDMLQAGTVSLEKYNEAVTAGHAIQESNVRVQELLNQVRRDQLPLLAQEQQAYEANLQYLTGLNAEEQRRALMLQDSSVQAQIATLYNTAYSASLGEIPKEVATEMIVEAANADAALKDLLLNLGLISEVDGEIRVNFPDADATVSAINRVTMAILAVQAAAEGRTIYQVAIDVYGYDEAVALLGYVEDADGKRHYIEVETTVTGTGELQTAAADLKEVTLADGTVVTVKTDVDTSDWDHLTAAELADRFQNDPVQIPVEGVIKPMDGVSPEEWNTMIGPYPEIEIPATVKVSDTTPYIPPDLLSPTGNLPALELPMSVDSTQAEADIASVAATVPPPVTQRIVGDKSVAMSDIATVNSAMIPDKTLQIRGDEKAVMASLRTVNTANIDDKTLTIHGSNQAAIDAINTVNNMAVYDKTMTISVVTAYSSVGTPSGFSAFQHGGIPRKAHGGVPVTLAEVGPELLHFANGGTMPIYGHGNYTVPPMTYVSPANTRSVGGPSIVVDLSGSTFVGTSRAQMDDWAKTSLIPSIRRVIQDERMGQAL